LEQKLAKIILGFDLGPVKASGCLKKKTKKENKTEGEKWEKGKIEITKKRLKRKMKKLETKPQNPKENKIQKGKKEKPSNPQKFTFSLFKRI